jgi:hypothetical protein
VNFRDAVYCVEDIDKAAVARELDNPRKAMLGAWI